MRTVVINIYSLSTSSYPTPIKSYIIIIALLVSKALFIPLLMIWHKIICRRRFGRMVCAILWCC